MKGSGGSGQQEMAMLSRQTQRNPVTECIGVVEMTCSRALPECFRKYLGTALQKLDNLVGLYIYIYFICLHII